MNKKYKPLKRIIMLREAIDMLEDYEEKLILLRQKGWDEEVGDYEFNDYINEIEDVIDFIHEEVW